jgi:hypothetical protein
MRVRINDPALVGDLERYLKAAECSIERVDEATLDVTIPRAPNADQARREVDIYVKTWSAMNAGVTARVI